MKKLFIRILLSILPIIYMTWIWLQSAHFNPSMYEHYWKNPYIFFLFGGALELAHLIEFGILYLLIIVSFLTFGRLNTKIEIIAVIISITYAAIDEIHQSYVPFRSSSVIDLFKNILGIWGIWYIVRKRYYHHKHSKFGIFLKAVTNFTNSDKSNIYK